MAEIAIPHPQEALVTEDGRINKTWYDRFAALFTQYRETTRDLADASSGLGTKAANSQPWSECIIIEFPDNGDYPFLKPGYAATWTEVETDCLSGTCTLTVKIGSTPLGGTANSVSTTRTAQSHTTANAMAATDDLVLTVSANASCQRMTVTIRGTRTFA